MRVVHVVSSVADEANGLSRAVLQLCDSLNAGGTDAQLAALDSEPSGSPASFLTTFPRGRGPRQLGASPLMSRWLAEKAADDRLDLIHNHGLWTMPNVYAGQVCRRYSNCRLIVSPHGTLSQWALGFHALRKRVFWHLLQGRSVRGASCFHATGKGEYEDIRRLSFTQPVSILPNGVDVPKLIRHEAVNRRRQLLFLGRIHPKKGVLTLLRAWGAVAHRCPDWEL